MKFRQSPYVMVRRTKEKGWGVFARKFIPCDTLIEQVPVLVFPTSQLYSPAGTSALGGYVFVWDEDHVAIALGYGSLYNHSYQPNARYIDDDPCVKQYFAIRDIEAGEEITINYNAEPENRAPVGFEVK